MSEKLIYPCAKNVGGESMSSEGRRRTLQRRRQQRKLEALWDPEQNAWQKHAKCVICRRKFCVNNYPDRKVRVNKHKIGGKIVCPWCSDRDGKFIVQLMIGCEKWSEMTAEHYSDTCQCTACKVTRILKRHSELPVRN
jgi:hypothetical protein